MSRVELSGSVRLCNLKREICKDIGIDPNHVIKMEIVDVMDDYTEVFIAFKSVGDTSGTVKRYKLIPEGGNIHRSLAK